MLITTQSLLNSAIISGGSHTLSNNITLTADLDTFTGVSFELDGGNYTISGDGTYKMFDTASSFLNDITIKNVKLIDAYTNATDAHGSAIKIGKSRTNAFDNTIKLQNVTIMDSLSKGLGGGVFIHTSNASTSAVVLENVSIINCSAGAPTGTPSSYDPTLLDTHSGGGMWIALASYTATAELVNCNIAQNHSYYAVGGLQINSGGRSGGINAKVNLRNCTIYNNNAVGAYGGVFIGQHGKLHNTILYANKVNGTSGTNGSDLGGTPTQIDIQYSLIGHSNVLASPAFPSVTAHVSAVTATDGRTYYNNIIGSNPQLIGLSAIGNSYVYQIPFFSVAIDAGDRSSSAVSTYPTYDIRGTGYSRLMSAGIDLGAYEFDTTVLTIPEITAMNPMIALSGSYNIKLYGSNFFGTGSICNLLIDNTSYNSNVTTSSSTLINFTMPPLTSGFHQVGISANSGIGNLIAFQVVVPELTAISTSIGVAGETISLYGRYFTSTASLYFTSTSGTYDASSYVVSNSDSLLVFTIPPLVANPSGYRIYVSNSGGVSNTFPFSIRPAYSSGRYASFGHPIIKFTGHVPERRTIISGDTVSDGLGSVHVSVFDNALFGSVSAISSHFGLLNGSVGEIDYTSVVQTTSAQVDFDIINISAYGSVLLSAMDTYGSSTSADDGLWYYSCPDNKLINLVNFLPSNLYGSQTYDFVKFFQDFLNTMYVDLDSGCNDGILRKIEKIRDFNDPDLIDINYINFYASKLGYNLNLSRGALGLFTTSGTSSYETLTGTELENANKYLRFVVKNLPNWYKIKTTKNAIKIMLFSYGIIGDLITLYSNDYNDNWMGEEEDDTINITSEMPSDYYPTPHFSIQIDVRQTAPSWLENIDHVIEAIEIIRPINTVFDRLSGIYSFDSQVTTVRYGNVSKGLYIYIPWTNSSPATL